VIKTTDCDFCGKKVESRFIIYDGDLALCSDCFIDIYLERLERETGVQIVDRTGKRKRNEIVKIPEGMMERWKSEKK